LNLSKVASAPLKSQVSPLTAPLDNAISNLKSAVEEAGASISRDEQLPMAVFDPGLMVLVFQNLLSNAVKFRRPGDCRIHVGCRANEGECIVHVRDNGIGLD